jgi:carotenoid 1,2-hydratase
MWGVARPSRSDGAGRVVKTLEDTPFYTRSMIETELLGETRISMHESLDLRRFASTWVKCLLPFRMPRAF